MKKKALLAAVVLTLSMGSAHAATQAEAANAIAAAVDATLAAAKVGGEWRDTYKMIGKAKAAYKKGKYDDAVKLANKCKAQGELGQAQAKAEANAGIPDYVYKEAGMKK
jgi:argininosuccinate lyase